MIQWARTFWGPVVYVAVIAFVVIVLLGTQTLFPTEPPLDCELGFAYARLADGTELCLTLPAPTAGGM